MSIKEMARELYYGKEWDKTETHGDCVALIERTIRAAVAEAVVEERETCAVIAATHKGQTAQSIAGLIRARTAASAEEEGDADREDGTSHN